MSETYKVMVVGMGKRGKHHASAFHANDRFEVVGLCDIDQSVLDAAAPACGNPQTGTDAAALAAEVKPDVFCFCTHPTLRMPLIKIGVESGAKLIAFEKPVAPSSSEAMEIRDLLQTSGVKAVVSHQHRYGTHYRKVREIIESGALGRIHTVYASATGWMLHMMTHMIDYMRWYNNDAPAEWVMGQACGRGKLNDNHPSPDYIAGVIHFANGVRGWIDVGAGAPDQPEVAKWWGKNRIGVQGTDGFAEVLTNGGWRAVTKDGAMSGDGAMNYDLDMPPYIAEMADWLEDEAKVHSCCFDSAYAGFEIMSALCRSVLEGGQVALPLTEGMDETAALRASLPEKKVLFSFEESKGEYPESL
ncbi:MAG: Gfo/Idh/MocA family oxidoreductase [Lentisphaerae bacterium]|nr:Gfo/Idh/MocA family oxidoreductase [Lentisphaerota bacterium]